MNTTQLIRYLGLCRKAGGVIRGTELIQKALHRSVKPVLVLLASDASERTAGQIAEKCRSAAVPLWRVGADKYDLAACIGASSPCAALAVLPGRGPADAMVALYQNAVKTHTQTQNTSGNDGALSQNTGVPYDNDDGLYDRKDD